GALFPITALPSGLTWIAKFLPLTHGLALLRYGLNDDANRLHSIWKLSDPTAMAGLSLAVVAVFAALLTAVSIRAFTNAAPAWHGAAVRPCVARSVAPGRLGGVRMPGTRDALGL